eukprot:734682-Amphidinium_carterae.1
MQMVCWMPSTHIQCRSFAGCLQHTYTFGTSQCVPGSDSPTIPRVAVKAGRKRPQKKGVIRL